MKIQWKNDAKIEGFWWPRTTFGVIRFAYNTLSPFSEKVEKSMPKGSPKVEVFAPKTDLGRSRVDWFCHFGRFLRIRKIIVFSMSFWVVEKSIKIEPWGVKGRKRRCEPSANHRRVGYFGHRGSQGGGHYQRYSRNKGSRIAKQTLTRHGPLARRICIDGYLYKVVNFLIRSFTEWYVYQLVHVLVRNLTDVYFTS